MSAPPPARKFRSFAFGRFVWPRALPPDGGAAPATVKPRGGGDDPVPRHAYAAMGFVSAGRQGVFERS